MTDNPRPDNPDAFPVLGGSGITHHGMTLLDWFAGKVASGMCISSDLHANTREAHDAFAIHAYDRANALLRERERRMRL